MRSGSQRLSACSTMLVAAEDVDRWLSGGWPHSMHCRIHRQLRFTMERAAFQEHASTIGLSFTAVSTDGARFRSTYIPENGSEGAFAAPQRGRTHSNSSACQVNSKSQRFSELMQVSDHFVKRHS